MTMIKPLASIALVSLLTLLAACGGEEVVLPPAEPLSASKEELQQLYKIEPGPYEVVKIGDASLAATHRDLELSIYYPKLEDTNKQQFPFLLFSHGNWSNKDSYDRVINHWVSHGYIVVSPNHLDCCSMAKGIINSLRYGQVGLIEGRIEDFSFILDNLSAIEALAPAIKDRINTDLIAATGHSFGAYTAQQFGGASTFDPDQEKYRFFRDERIKAIVAISPPGEMFDTITDQSWVEMDKPMMLTTGTWDSNAAFWPDWRAHKLSFDTAKPGQNYALVTQGADHYLGNLICTLDREVAPQHDALKMVQISTTAFLDAFIKGDNDAASFIGGDQLATITKGFSVIERR